MNTYRNYQQKGRGEGRNATSDVSEYIQELKEKRKRRRKKCVALKAGCLS